MARECGQGRGQPRPSSPVPVPVPVDPVPVTASEDDGDSSSVPSDHPDPPASVPFPSASDRPRKLRVKRSTASKPSPFAKPAAPVVFPVTDEYWFHVKELLDKALSNAPCSIQTDRLILTSATFCTVTRLLRPTVVLLSTITWQFFMLRSHNIIF